MAHGTADIRELPLKRLDPVPGSLRTAIVALLVLGAASFITALIVDPARAWRAYMFNWLFWVPVAQGAVIVAAVVLMVKGLWARGIRRISLSFVAFLPIGYLLLLPPLFFGGEALFPWLTEDLHGKEVWLNIPLLIARNVIGVAALLFMSLWFAYWALRPDAGRLRNSAPARLRGLYERLSRNWRGDAEEETIAERKLSRLAPPLAIVYALAMSIVTFDFVMALDYHWFSTLIGGYFFMGAFLGGLAATAIATAVYRRTFAVEDVIDRSKLHDLGKLLFGFCIFWVYLLWSQFLVIWYGQLPWEQGFLIQRLERPFIWLALVVLFSIFVIPFFGLLGVGPKRKPPVLAGFASLVLLGLWLERYMLTYPSHYQGMDRLVFGWPEVGTALAFAGLFLGSLAWFASRFPMLQLWAPAHERELLATSAEHPGEVVTEDYGEEPSSES